MHFNFVLVFNCVTVSNMTTKMSEFKVICGGDVYSRYLLCIRQIYIVYVADIYCVIADEYYVFSR
jgi:hypothetical protein